MRRVIAAVLVACAGCYASHERAESALPEDAGGRADAGPRMRPTPRRPHACVSEPQRIVDMPADWLGKVRVVSRGPDYAVTWSFPGAGAGLALVMYDGRVMFPESYDVEVVALADGYIVWNYTSPFRRLGSAGEPVGDALMPPEIVPPHWQSLELHGDRLRFVTHAITGGDAHVHEIDVAAWSARRVALEIPPEPGHRYAFTSDRALIVHRGDGLGLQGQRTGPDGASVVEFDIPAPLFPSDIRFDEGARSWRLAGEVVTPAGEHLLASARVSVDGELAELATLPADAEDTEAAIWAENGPEVAIAASPIGPAMAAMPSYFGRESRAGVSVVYPSEDGSLRGGGVFGVPSSFQPAIAWSDADQGFAIVSVERDASDQTYLALRCGLRP